jgi:hypothetical protein
MLRTAMPEATIDEDGDSEARESYVSDPPRLLQYPKTDPIS